MPDQPIAAPAAVTATAIALNRFGLGAHPNDAAPADPRAWLFQQLDHYEPLPPAIAALGDPNAHLTAAMDALRALRQAASGTADRQNQEDRRAMLQAARSYYQDAVNARARAALVTPTPFLERLVHFWSNHFAVSMDKAAAIPFIPIFETTAIRPHLLGRFEDMLVAVERHPAMLLYLDQAQSAGPNSQLAQLAQRRAAKRQPGLNENLAREILELHTLGVRTGYTQADVTEFARALTGWSIDNANANAGPGPGLLRRFANRNESDPPPSADGFLFRPAIHEPGDRTLLGRKYKQEGEAQARAILHDLATSPATARHLASKLAIHFAGDAPPQALIDRLAAAFEKSSGHLPTLYRALIDSPETWTPAPVKFKNPWERILSALRACGIDRLDNFQLSKLQFAPLLTQLGQPVWRPGSPAGWDDTAATWAAPDALLRRVELAQRFAAAATRQGALEPKQLAERILPGSLGPQTQAALSSADTRATALALLLVSPEFQRR